MRKDKNDEENLKARLADAAFTREYIAITLEEYTEMEPAQHFCSL